MVLNCKLRAGTRGNEISMISSKSPSQQKIFNLKADTNGANRNLTWFTLYEFVSRPVYFESPGPTNDNNGQQQGEFSNSIICSRSPLVSSIDEAADGSTHSIIPSSIDYQYIPSDICTLYTDSHRSSSVASILSPPKNRRKDQPGL